MRRPPAEPLLVIGPTVVLRDLRGDRTAGHLIRGACVRREVARTADIDGGAFAARERLREQGATLRCAELAALRARLAPRFGSRSTLVPSPARSLSKYW